MPTITCSQCGRNFADEELFCPHCGAAQIPQATRGELLRQQAQVRRTPRGIKVGCLVGLIVGVMLFGAVRLWWPLSEGVGDIGFLVVAPVLGAVSGLLVQRWLRPRRPVGGR